MSRLTVLFFPIAALIPAIAPGQIPDGAVKLAALHEAWGPKASSPNTSLTIRQSSRDGDTLKFRLYAKGVPQGKLFSLVTWPVTQKGPSTVLTGITLDSSGMAVCSGKPGACGAPNKPNDPIDLALTPLPGEPVRLGLVAADGDLKIFAKSVPIPLKGQDRGCTLEAVMLTPGAELLRMEGSGFAPNSEIKMDSDSEGEKRNGQGKAGPDGKYMFAILPFKQGASQGNIHVNLVSAKCSPSVTVPWGQHALR